MGFLSRLFGDCGTVRYEGTTEGGQEFTGKINMESFNNSREEIECKLREIVFVETGKRVTSLTVVGFAANYR